MNDQVIKKFVASAIQVLSTELGVGARVDQPSAQGDYYVSKGVTALIGVTGRLRGMVIFGLNEETALKLVSHMMGSEFEKLDEVAQSGVAEMANVVVGSFVTSLAELGFSCGITPPAVMIGKDTVISTPNIKRLVIPLQVPIGNIEIQLALRDNRVNYSS
ncbi:MAG: chemotaxis protein CheX [Chloroflexota bacterium]